MATMFADQADALLALAKAVVAAQPLPENLIISPISIHILLAMSAAGANGPTQGELLRYFKLENMEQLYGLFSHIATSVLADGSPFGGPVLSTKNSVWIDGCLDLKPIYGYIVENYYNGVAGRVDFQNRTEESRKQVNAWVEKETKGLIKDILKPGSVSRFTRIILANTVYFKGAWAQEEFDASLTKDRDFYLLNGTSVRAPFMTCRERQQVGVFDGFKVLRLPYKQGRDSRSFSMYIYLPDARYGLPALWERICSEPNFINRHIPYTLEKLTAFYLPRFKIEFEFVAKNVLMGLGMVNLFNMGSLAEMAESPHSDDAKYLYPQEILHKAVLEVNEQGTEAAAVTAMMLFGCSLYQPPPLDFVADHPFAFLIREDTTGLLLFVGQLLNPLSNAT